MLSRLFAVLAALISIAALARAQDATPPQPVFGSSSAETNAQQPADSEVKTGLEVLVIGDALGGGLGAGLSRRAEIEGGVSVAVRFNEESGVARPEVYDWTETLPKILEGKTYDAVVVLMGSNDRQAIRAQSARYEFNTPEWITAYKAQLDKILDVLAAAHTRTYWVSIPPMADPDYEAAMAAIAAIQKERAEAKGATFVDIRPSFLSADGRYTDVGPDDTGEVRKLRSRDGVSFFKQGNNRMGQLVLAAIKAGGEAPPAVPSVQNDENATEPAVTTPLFGQAGIDGIAITFNPPDPGVEAIRGIIDSGDTGAALATLQSLSPPGSSAEKLFVAGEAPPPPPGRSDDFSLMK
jgi:hypothetical protein